MHAVDTTCLQMYTARGTRYSQMCGFGHFINVVYMSAVNPGFGGQGFIPSQISKIARLRQMCNELGVNPWIEVDGGISPKNAAEVGAWLLQ